MAKTWTRGTDFASMPATVPYTSGSATNWLQHGCSGFVPAHIFITNRGTVAAYIAQGITLTDGAARSGEGHRLDPGETRRLSFCDANGMHIGADRVVWHTVGANLELCFTIFD